MLVSSLNLPVSMPLAKGPYARIAMFSFWHNGIILSSAVLSRRLYLISFAIISHLDSSVLACFICLTLKLLTPMCKQLFLRLRVFPLHALFRVLRYWD